MQQSKSGFTIVELIVVIMVIGILATITAVLYTGAQARARDTARMSNLEGISHAIKLHRIKYGNDVSTGSGCGESGNGSGWFNFSGTLYPQSILSCLTDAGYLDEGFIDPFGCMKPDGPGAADPNCKKAGYAYAKYTCVASGSTTSYLYARLEQGGSEQKLYDANVCSSRTMAQTYHMNYMLVVD